VTDQQTQDAPAETPALDKALALKNEQIPHTILSEATEPDSIIRYEVAVPSDYVDSKTDAVLQDLVRQVVIPGFRRGKAPMKFVRNRHGKDARDEAVRKMAAKLAELVAKEKDVTTVGEPLFDGWKAAENGDAVVAILLEVRPTVAITDEVLQGLEVEALTADVADDKVDARIQELRLQNATFEAKGDDATFEAGDALVADVTNTADEHHGDGPQTESATDEYFEKPEEAFPIVVLEALAGKKKGDTVEAEDRHAHGDHEHVTQYKVTIKEIKKRVLPELDDDFAKDVSDDHESLAAMRAKIREELEEAAKDAQKRQVLAGAFKALRERLEFPVPQTLVRRVAGQQIDSTEERLRGMGMSLNSLGKDFVRNFVDRALVEAADEVREILISEAIADHWNVEASDEMLNAELEKIGAQQGRKALAIRAQLEANQRLEAFKAELRMRATHDKLAGSVKVNIVEKLTVPEPAEGEEPAEE
jgi:trigger factor